MTSPNDRPEHEQHGFVRVAVVSPDLRIGDVEFNVAAILKAMNECHEAGCRVVVFPELCLTGYSCADLFYLPGLQQAAARGLAAIAAGTSPLGLAAVVGLPLAVQDRLYNVAAVAAGGAVCGMVPKTFLPNSAEFYERRWFSPAPTLQATSAVVNGQDIPIGVDLLFELQGLPGAVLGLEVCEDLWTVIPPSSLAALAGATIIGNASASDELLGKMQYRRALVTQQSARCQAAYLYSGAGPGESTTDVVYAGHGIIAENGVTLTETERFSFTTQAAIADIDVQRIAHERFKSAAFRDQPGGAAYRRITVPMTAPKAGASRLRRHVAPRPFVPSDEADRRQVCEEIFSIQATGLARRLMHVRAKTAIVGLSGGLDSTLALLVALNALKRAGMKREQALAVTMPGFGTTARTRGNAEKLAEALGIPLRTIAIEAAVKQHFTDIGHPPDQHDVTYENAQARERTQILMDIANQTGGIVVGTGDLSEAALGWCTFNGDHISMYHVNSGVPKTLVRYLIEWCAAEMFAAEAGAVLHDIIDTPISPELLPVAADGGLQQKTEDTVGPYELHDFFLFHFVRHGCPAAKIRFLASIAFAGRYTDSEIEKWLGVFMARFAQSQFKRSVMPDGPKVGSVALSPRGDWRMPSDFGGDLTNF